jgi:hypothetical protein
MNREMRNKYGLAETTNFNSFQEDIVKKKNHTCCFMTSLLFTILNGIYFSGGVYIYYNYIHNTSLNNPEDIDNTYNKLKYLIDYSCTNIPNINC